MSEICNTLAITLIIEIIMHHLEEPGLRLLKPPCTAAESFCSLIVFHEWVFKKKRCLPFFSSSSSSPFIWGQGYYSLLERFLSLQNSSHKYSSQIVPRLSPLFILDKSHCIRAFNNVLYYPALSLLPLWRQSLLELLVIQISLPVRNASNIILALWNY